MVHSSQKSGLKGIDFIDTKLYNKLIVWSRYYRSLQTPFAKGGLGGLFGGKSWQQE
jgi:hypothetical protein